MGERTGRGLEASFEAFRRRVDAVVVGLMPITQSVDDRTYFGQGSLVGDPARVRSLEQAIVGRALTSSWSPSAPRAEDMNRFVLPLQRGHYRERRLAYEHVEPLYGTSRVQDTMRMLLYDGAVCIGWFGCLRADDAPDFDRRALELGRSQGGRLAMELVARHRRDHELLRKSPAHVVVGPRGKILATSPEVAPWLSRRRARAFADAAKEVRRRGPSIHVVGRYAFRAVVLQSDDESTLVYFNAPLGTFRDVALKALTPRQLQVANLLALGFSAAECAEELGIAHFTVKQHLAAVYRLVGVSRREELVAILRSRMSRGAES